MLHPKEIYLRATRGAGKVEPTHLYPWAGGGGCGFHQVLFAGIGDMMMELPMSSSLKEWTESTTSLPAKE